MTDEQKWFSIIAFAGESFSLLNEALIAAKKQDFDASQRLLGDSENILKEAHHIQNELLENEINGKSIEFSMLFTHAQDHLMNVILAQNIYRELIELQHNNH